eukprot:403374762
MDQKTRNQFLTSNIFEKDEDCKNNPFVFEKFQLGSRKEEYANVKFEGPLFKKSKNSENELKERYYIYQEQRILQFNTMQDTQERGILNIKYARLKKLHFTDETGAYVYGFILMGKGNQIELYHHNKKHVDAWIEKLKDSVILVDLKEDYTIGSLIGKGNFAKVHVCRRKSDEKSYALKSVEKALIKKSKRNSSSILLEIDILRLIQQDHIIKLYEVYESDKYIHLVFEYLEGGELFERIKSKGLYQEKDAINVMRNLLQALDYLHQKGIVHRDLKPENLILASKDNDYNLKIADFGLASFINKGELLYLRCGSPGYVAPELLEDKGYYCKADIFSAGVILYVMLTGRPAFPGTNIHEILMKNKRGDVQYPPKYWEKISIEAKDLVGKMLNKDPRNRISAKEALNHQWFNTEDTNTNNLAEVMENIKNLDQEMYIDTRDLKNEDINILTCTPLLGARQLQGFVPQSPFLTNNSMQRDGTPMMRVQMRVNGDSTQLQLGGGIVMNRPVPISQQQQQQLQADKKGALGIAAIPDYKRAVQQKDPNLQATPITNLRRNIANLEQKSPALNLVIKAQPRQNPSQIQGIGANLNQNLMAADNVQKSATITNQPLNTQEEEKKVAGSTHSGLIGGATANPLVHTESNNSNPIINQQQAHQLLPQQHSPEFNNNFNAPKLEQIQNKALIQNSAQKDQFNDDEEEQYFNIDDNSLLETEIIKINKPSKRRVTINDDEIKALGQLFNNQQQSDVGGDGGNIYLLDYEELKKVLNDTTGPTVQKIIGRNAGSSAGPFKNNYTHN